MPDSHSSSDLEGLDPGELLARAYETAKPTGGANNWTPPAPEELGRLIPQYRIESLLGRGGMGAVYKAWQPSLDRAVAIKLLPVEFADDERFVARFQREARTLAKLQHARIVTIHDSGQTSEGHLYFVMEYIDGTDLRKILRGPGLDPEQALAVVGQLCDALQAAHRVGIVHRDIKPENVLITSDGYVKLADFGLAQPPKEEGVASITQTNVIMGTPSYMAPEQHLGSAVADPRSDIFALGVMFYEMLTGKRPQGVFDPPSHKVQVDVRIDGVVLKALQAEPERRYQSIQDLKSEVEHIRSTPPPAPAAPLRPPRAVRAEPARWPTFALGLLIAALLGVIAYLIIKQEPRALPPAGPVATQSTPTPQSIAPPPPQLKLIAAPSTPAATIAAATPKPLEADFTPVLDRDHTDGWEWSPNGGMPVINGVWTTHATGVRGFNHYLKKSYRDLILRLEYRAEKPVSNSGVILRNSPQSGARGYEVQIFGSSELDKPTGTIYGVGVDVPLEVPTVAAQSPDGQWNEMEISVIGQRYRVWLNGRLITDFTGNRSLSGNIGFQSHPRGPVEIRNIRIKELPTEPAAAVATVPSSTLTPQTSPVPASSGPRSLQEALLNYPWEWTHAPKPPDILTFHEDGTATCPRFSWHWKVTSARTALAFNAIDGGKPVPGFSATLTFNEAWTALIGTTSDGRYSYTGKRLPANYVPPSEVRAPSPVPATQAKEISLFNGRDLTGWSGLPQVWAVQDGAIIGRISEKINPRHNTFLVWQGMVTDFELSCKYKLVAQNSEEKANSGVQFRAVMADASKFSLKGYQAEMDPGTSHPGSWPAMPNMNGCLTDDPPGTLLATVGEKKVGSAPATSLGTLDTSARSYRKDDWNDYRIVAVGNHIQVFVNGLQTIDFTDQSARYKSGLLGFQIHSFGKPLPKTVQFKDIRLKTLTAQP